MTRNLFATILELIGRLAIGQLPPGKIPSKACLGNPVMQARPGVRDAAMPLSEGKIR